MNQDSDFDADVLRSQLDKAKQQVLSLAKQMFENNIKFGTDFDANTKTALKEQMTRLLVAENQLKQKKHTLNCLKQETLDLVQNVDTEQQANDILDSLKLDERFGVIFASSVEDSSFDPTQHEQFQSLVHLLGDEPTTDEQEDLEMLPTDFTIPMDPFSRQEIVDPVRNKNCKHLYDKEQFFKMFENQTHRSVIKCPIGGCANTRVTINDIEDDPRTKILIENAKRQSS